MKLLNCIQCNDIVALGHTIRSCMCGESRGHYIDEAHVEYSGPSRVLGILNQQYNASFIDDSVRAFVPAKRYDYVWFSIPEGHNIRRVDQHQPDSTEAKDTPT